MTTTKPEAGAVCYRLIDGKIRFLLVRTRKGNKQPGNRWIYPKGKTEPGETAADAAKRETEQESGFTGEIVGDAVGSFLVGKREPVWVEAYLLKVTGATEEGPEYGREPTWFPYDEARKKLGDGREDNRCNELEGLRHVLNKAWERIKAVADKEQSP